MPHNHIHHNPIPIQRNLQVVFFFLGGGGGVATKRLRNYEKNEESSSRSSTFGKKLYKEINIILEIVASWVSRAALVKAPAPLFPSWTAVLSLQRGKYRLFFVGTTSNNDPAHGISRIKYMTLWLFQLSFCHFFGFTWGKRTYPDNALDTFAVD